MDFIQTTLTGAIAGLTIFISLPIARMGRGGKHLRIVMSGIAAGILLFLLMDVLGNSIEMLQRTNGLGNFILGVFVFLFGFIFAFGGLQAYTHNITSQKIENPFRLSTLIAIGIGLHNFGEGLAIGASAASGLLSLAFLLVIGFALHNSTEGFGIAAPLISVNPKPSWGFLAKMGAIGGFPTIVGAMVGFFVLNSTVYILFMSGAAGAILFVIVQLYGSGLRAHMKREFLIGVAVGFIIAYLTDAIVSQFV